MSRMSTRAWSRRRCWFCNGFAIPCRAWPGAAVWCGDSPACPGGRLLSLIHEIPPPSSPSAHNGTSKQTQRCPVSYPPYICQRSCVCVFPFYFVFSLIFIRPDYWVQLVYERKVYKYIFANVFSLQSAYRSEMCLYLRAGKRVTNIMERVELSLTAHLSVKMTFFSLTKADSIVPIISNTLLNKHCGLILVSLPFICCGLFCLSCLLTPPPPSYFHWLLFWVPMMLLSTTDIQSVRVVCVCVQFCMVCVSIQLCTELEKGT